MIAEDPTEITKKEKEQTLEQPKIIRKQKKHLEPLKKGLAEITSSSG